MKWILVVLLTNSPYVVIEKFDTEAACASAKAAISGSKVVKSATCTKGG